MLKQNPPFQVGLYIIVIDLHDTIPYICALNKGNGRIYRRKYIRLYESLSK